MLIAIFGHLLGLGVGISLGLMGGGGAVLAVPILIYIMGLGTQEAIAMSLVCIGCVSLIGVIPHWRQGHICLKTAAMFAPPAMLGAYLGARASTFSWVTDSMQLMCFASTVIVASFLMIYKGKRTPRDSLDLHSKSGSQGTSRFKYLAIPAEGLSIGALTGFVGVGGGFAIVPALVLLSGIPIKTAVGTSLLIISLKSVTGFIGYADSVTVNWILLASFTLSASMGSIIGAQSIRFIHPPDLQKGFGFFILAIAIIILVGHYSV